MENKLPERLQLIYFSPTGSTLKTAHKIAEGIGLPHEETEIKAGTAPGCYKNEFILFAFPVFGGRIPSMVADWLSSAELTGCVAGAAVVYGNRAYDDALSELVHIVRKGGGCIIGAGAFIAEHSIVRTIAEGRPDECDLVKAVEFGRKLKSCILPMNTEVPGNIPTEKATRSALRPIADDNCTDCGRCAELCPVKAIRYDDLKNTDDSRCISCMRCISICPVHARALPKAVYGKVEAMLNKAAAERKDAEVFF